MLILDLFMMHFNLLLGIFSLRLSLSMAFCAAHSPTQRLNGTEAVPALQDNQRVGYVGTVVHLPFSVFSQWRNLLSKHRTCLAVIDMCISREGGHVIFAMQGIMMHLECHMYVGS